MTTIPLPFVIALLLSILAVVLYIRREEATKSAFVFVALCAVTTTVVGLRWTVELPVFRLLQPILASCIPVTAWYCFSSAHKQYKNRTWHLLPPILFVFGSMTYPLWQPPIDPIMILLYVGYGVALIRASFKGSDLPEQVRFSDIDFALRAERIAGIVLLMSAAIDTSMAVDFTFYSGDHALKILSIGHALLLPLIAMAVVVVSLSVVTHDPVASDKNTQSDLSGQHKDKPLHQLTEDEVKSIVHKIDHLLTSKEIFLDPDLTLDRLARKACIPARQISVAINQAYGRNVSQVVNEYRIERAKSLLVESDKTITQIYFDSGFQSRSNFNREFARITQQTPSAYRRSNPCKAKESGEG